MRAAVALFAASAGCTAGGGLLFSATQHVSAVSGLYWAVTTATTVGYGDVAPRNTGGQLLAMAVMLTTVPLLAAAFAQLHLDRVKLHVDRRLDRHHDKLSGQISELRTSQKEG